MTKMIAAEKAILIRPLGEWIRMVGVSASALGPDDFNFAQEVARAHGLLQAYYYSNAVDADVASYAIEAAEALGL